MYFWTFFLLLWFFNFPISVPPNHAFWQSSILPVVIEWYSGHQYETNYQKIQNKRLYEFTTYKLMFGDLFLEYNVCHLLHFAQMRAFLIKATPLKAAFVVLF